jgi:predicted transposase YbfD/YdcC
MTFCMGVWICEIKTLRTEGHPVSVCHGFSPLSTSAGGDDDADITSLLDALGRVTDRRKSRGKLYRLVFILAISLVAALAGASNFREIGDHVADFPQSLLCKLGAKWCFFRLGFGFPSERTIRRVMENIDAAEFDLLVGAWLRERARREADGVVALSIDGKVLRGSWTGENGQFTLFSAMLHEVGVTVAQVQVPAGTNEITQVEALLAGVPADPGTRVVLTMDAAHTQRDTAEHIVGERGFDYFMTVKGNQPLLRDSIVKKCLPFLKGDPHHIVEERGHGRVNRWSTWITDAEGIDFPHAQQVGCIRREVFTLTGERISKEHAWLITSSPTADTTAGDLHKYVRYHWGIENKSHYVRDTAWHEDTQQIYTGSGPQTMATLRNLAVGLLRLNGVTEIKRTIEWIGRDQSRALPLMAT